MAKRNNALTELANGFLSTRSESFDKFLHNPPQTIVTNGSGQKMDTTAESSAGNIAEDIVAKTIGSKENKEKVNTGTTIHTPVLEVVVKNSHSSQAHLVEIQNTDLSPYESLFFSKSDVYKSDYDDRRVYIKGANAKILSRLVLYAEQNKRHISVQLILDNILRHHFETFALEIKQIDQMMLGILQKQVND